MDLNMFNVIFAVMFVYMAFQVRRGNTDVLGRGLADRIRPDSKDAFCREMSMPIIWLAAIEIVDMILQDFFHYGTWSMLVVGSGVIISFVWIYLVHRKYKK